MQDFLLNGKRTLVITGKVNSGKSSRAKAVIKHLKETGKTVSGVLSVGIFSGSAKIGYEVMDLSNGNCFNLASDSPIDKNNLSQGRFYFDQNVFDILNESIIRNITYDIILFDEIGYLELSEEGFYPSVKFCQEKFKGKLVVVIREDLLDDVFDKFNVDRCGVEVMKL